MIGEYELRDDEGPKTLGLVELDVDFEPTAFVPSPVSFGFEIEQPDYSIKQPFRRAYKWHYDGSGPFETAWPPMLRIGDRIKKFVRLAKTQDATFAWVNEFQKPNQQRWRGCGSHVHFRVRDDEVADRYFGTRARWVEAWTTAYNTIKEVCICLLPMFAWGSRFFSAFGYRQEATEWAEVDSRRYAPPSMAQFLRPTYNDHPYHFLSMNQRTSDEPPYHTEKPLTMELRINEAHPVMAYIACLIIARIIRKCFQRGFVSPKLFAFTRNNFFHKASRAIMNSGGDMAANIYTELDNNLGRITFEPGRNFPGMKHEYPSYFALFEDILKKYRYQHIVSQRIERLFRAKGQPWKETDKIWDVFAPKGEFRWNENVPGIR